MQTSPAPSPLFSGVEWIWFDLDDTLIDFHANSRCAHRLLFDEQNGFDSTYDDFAEWLHAYETHNAELWRRYAAGEISQDFLRLDRFLAPLALKWRGDSEALETLCRYLDTRYLDLLAEQKQLVEGAREALLLARARGYKIGVLSNGFSSVQHRKIRSARLDDLVDTVVLSDDIGIAKPDPRLYLYAMARVNNLRPDAHLMIGDNLATDIKGAEAAGWKHLFFAPRDSASSSPADPPAECRIARLDELSRLI